MRASSAGLSIVVFAAGLALYLPGLGARDFWAPDEPRFADVARTMLRSGDWIVPRFAGRPLALLPPLAYWAAAGAARALGPGGELDEAAARLPIALAAAATLAACFALGRRVAGTAAGGAAAAALATMALFAWQARFLQADMLLVAAVAWTLVFFHGRAWIAAGIAAGIGTLAKGPVAVVLPALVAGAYLAARGGLGATLRSRGPWLGAAAWAAMAIPWYVAASLRGGGDFARELILAHNLGMFFDTWSHERPAWYYLANAPWALLPWAALVPAAFVWLARRVRPGVATAARDAQLFLLAWALAPLVFLSLSEAKQTKYLLPAFPPVAVAIGILVAEVRLARERANLRALFDAPLGAVAGLAALAGLAFAVLPLAAGLASPGPARATIEAIPAAGAAAAGLALALAAGGAALAALKGLCALAFGATAAAAAVAIVAAGTLVFPAMNEAKSPRALCQRLDALPHPGAPLGIYGIGVRQQGGYRFYSARPFVTFAPPGHEDEDERRGFADGDPALLCAFLAEPRPAYALVKRRLADDLRERLAPLAVPLFEAQVGSKRVVIFANRAAAPAAAAAAAERGGA